MAVYALETHGLVPGAFAGATDVSDIINVALLLLVTTLLLYLLVGNLRTSLRLSRRQAAERQQLIAELEAKNTELELVEAGIPHESIVLGFRPPEIRPHTGFAVG